jgi:hypothetical protein
MQAIWVGGMGILCGMCVRKIYVTDMDNYAVYIEKYFLETSEYKYNLLMLSATECEQ